ncbi:MAG: SRPBCC family protein [Alphaproteobacteria bacterium]
MPQLKGSRILRHPIEKVFRLALNLEEYPRILPYIQKVSINERSENHLVADLSLGLRSIAFTYTCTISFKENEKITVTSNSALFKSFRSECVFEKLDKQTTRIFYELDASFKNKLLEIPAKLALPIQTLSTINAFERYLNRAT